MHAYVYKDGAPLTDPAKMPDQFKLNGSRENKFEETPLNSNGVFRTYGYAKSVFYCRMPVLCYAVGTG